MYWFPNHLYDCSFLFLLGTWRDVMKFILSYKKPSHEEAQSLGVHTLL